MHDVLRDMGRDIVIGKGRKWPNEVTYLWDVATISRVLNRNKEASGVRGINLFRSGRSDIVSSQASKFVCTEELHILVLDGFQIEPDDFSKWSEALRCIRWDCMFCDGIPTDLKLSNLAVMDLKRSEQLERLWEDNATMQFPALRMLFLDGCNSLIMLPDSFGLSLPLLQTLTMRACARIIRLPDSVARLFHLKKLHLNKCSRLCELPEEFGSLVNLEDLSLEFCRGLTKLSASFGGLKMLKRLEMDFSRVRELPMNFGGLSCLDFLSIDCLNSVPESFNELQSLTSLHVKSISVDMGGRLILLLEAFGELTNLQLSGHETITFLPKSTENLKYLVHIEMNNCSNLQTVEALPSRLHHLDLNCCKRLTKIASFGEMQSLVFLNLAYCKCLRHVNGLEHLEALQYVNLMGCESIEDCVVLGRHKARALCKCYLMGSGFHVAYDNKWLEEEPALQQIVYYDIAIGFLPNNTNGLIEGPYYENKDEVITKVRITSGANA